MTTLTDTILEVCPELGIEVPVASIEKELRKLWEQDDARTNASLMNLVVYSEKPDALLENSAIVRNLTREHACRAILVAIDRHEPLPSLRAWITAHCHLADGRKSVCCEQIAFHLTGKVTGRFRNTVFSHLNSDLPLVFWWQGELSEILTERLVSVMDRFMIDSSSWKNPVASFAMIQEASQANPDLVIQDHAWTRSWQFRVGIASLFDDPVAQQALPEITNVEIIYHPDHRNSALQMLAWLAVQAGWKDDVSSPALAFISTAGQAISVALKSDSTAPPLSAVMIRASQVVVQVTQKAGASHVQRQVESGAYKATSLSPIDPTTPAELVAVQLARGGKNSLYQKILPRFLEMLGK
ncbi:MAG: glucose-6-phosphate dehydrogenase assembly protein OpcA [Akkermansiaceae bacterium]|nr:glucose-6-phosphate dehydrogenase assembly protein OpcA [Akkermansiaceae bacterium]